jgi:hypothetical protein
MSPLDSFWNGLLSLLAPIITPDWGKLIVLIPLLLLLLVLGFLARVVMAWVSLYRALPARGPKLRQRSIRPLVIAHVAAMAVGVVVVAAAFIVGSSDPAWNGRNSPIGLVVNLPLLILGLIIVVSGAGSGARLWDRHGRDDLEPDPIDKALAMARRHPGRAKRAVAFAMGVVLAGLGLGLGTAPGGATDQPVPVAVLPLLLLGLVLAVGAVGSAIAAVWGSDPDFDGSDSSGLVTTQH